MSAASPAGRPSGSYDPTEEHRGLAEELARLEAQAGLSWAEEAVLLERVGVRDGQSLLELGSGSGAITGRLLDLFPSSPISALDIRQDLLAAARARLEPLPARLELAEGSIYALPFADDRFDTALARFVFQHLDDPVAAAAETLRVLRPGGRLCVVDVDAALWGIAQPYRPDLAPIYARAERRQIRRGGNRLIGRRLWRILSEAGYEQVRLEAFVYHSDALGLEAFRPQMDPARLLPAVRDDLLSPGDYATLQGAYEQLFDAPEAYILMLGFMAHGVKPQRRQQ